MAIILSGDNTALGVAVETTYGVPVSTPTAYIPFTSHNFALSNSPSKNMSVKKSRGESPVGAGVYKIAGNIDTMLDNSTFSGILIGSTLGTETVSTSGSLNVHTFKFAPAGTSLPSLTFVADDADSYKQIYSGCKVDSLAITCKPSDFMSVKASIIGQAVSVVSGSLTPTIVNDNFFEFSQIANGTSSVNGTAYEIQDFTINIKNSLKEVYGSLSGRGIYGLQELNADVSGSFSVILDNASLPAFRTMLQGSASAPVQNAVPTVPVLITFTQTVSAGVAPSISFSLPNCTLTEGAITRSKNNLLTMSVKFVCQETSPGSADDILIQLSNSTSSLYI